MLVELRMNPRREQENLFLLCYFSNCVLAFTIYSCHKTSCTFPHLQSETV